MSAKSGTFSPGCGNDDASGPWALALAFLGDYDILEIGVAVGDHDVGGNFVSRRQRRERLRIAHRIRHGHRGHEAGNLLAVDIERSLSCVDRDDLADEMVALCLWRRARFLARARDSKDVQRSESTRAANLAPMIARLAPIRSRYSSHPFQLIIVRQR